MRMSSAYTSLIKVGIYKSFCTYVAYNCDYLQQTTFRFHVMMSHNVLPTLLKNREVARVVCLDIARAFDRVWHPGLLEKLSALGFSGTLHAWLTDYLKDRSLKVVLNGRESGVKSINAGVPQGSILGPLLFITFIDDISQDLENQSILYADEATIMSFVKSSKDRPLAATSLNQDLAKIETWAKTWNVLFGAAKCKTTSISNRRDADGNHPPLHFFRVTLEEADSLDLLGLTLNNNLSWNQVVTKMSKTAGQRLGLLRRISPYILYTCPESHHVHGHDTINNGIC